MTGRVSILTPVYNGANFIATTIESVLRQTYPDWEMIIVDDGSTDATADIVRSYDHAGIRYVYQPNRGQAAALNTGLDLATGAYITTLDADDWLTPDSLVCRALALDAQSELDAVYCDGWYCTESGLPVMRFSEYRPSDPEGDVYDALVQSCFFGTGASVMIRRERVEQRGLRYDTSIVMVQDWDFYVRLAEHASFGYVPSPTVWYRLHTANMTMSMPGQRKLDSTIRFKRKVLSSPRFAMAATSSKVAFFYALLIETLRANPQLQSAVVADPAFRALPPVEQARLLRLMATEYLLQGEYLDLAADWLRMAQSLARFDTKTQAVGWVARAHPRLAGAALSRWRASQPQPGLVSVLDLAMQIEQSAG